MYNSSSPAPDGPCGPVQSVHIPLLKGDHTFVHILQDMVFCEEDISTFIWIYITGGGGLVMKLCLTVTTPWTIACQALLSMGFPRQEYWNELPFFFSRVSSWSRNLASPAVLHCRSILYQLRYQRSPLYHWHIWKPIRRLPLWLSGKESACQCRRYGFDSWSRKILHAVGQVSPCATTTEACAP